MNEKRELIGLKLSSQPNTWLLPPSEERVALYFRDGQLIPYRYPKRPLSEVIACYKSSMRFWPFKWNGGRLDLTRDEMRWWLVRNLRDGEGLAWEEAFEGASEILVGTPAKAGRDMMRKSYEKCEKKLPEEARRQRTYKRRLPG